MVGCPLSERMHFFDVRFFSQQLQTSSTKQLSCCVALRGDMLPVSAEEEQMLTAAVHMCVGMPKHWILQVCRIPPFVTVTICADLVSESA